MWIFDIYDGRFMEYYGLYVFVFYCEKYGMYGWFGDEYCWIGCLFGDWWNVGWFMF